MPQFRTEPCPEQQVLSDFLLGKLDPKSSSDCEQHLSKCEPCVETISALDIGDTFQALVIESRNRNHEQADVADESIVDNLVHRLSVLSDRSSKPKDQRAADVVSLLEPLADGSEDDFLGKLDHFHIAEILGVGSSGVVFRAVDSQLNRDVAIKVLRPSLGEAARERFIAEARATANLHHPNIVSIFHVGTARSLAYMVMQWLPGETLEQRLRRDHILPHEETKRLGIQIANGLAIAHQKDLVHRDIKPANLWITEDGDVKILDFGLVRIMDENPQLTCTGMIAGTPCFMSPEQSRGDVLDARSDLFSLGCVLYQSLTGKLPFASANALATLQAIQRDQPATPHEIDASVPTDLSDLVMMLLEKSPHRRPSTADELAEALQSERKDWPFACNRYEPAKLQPAPKRPTTKPLRQRSNFWSFIGLAMLTGMFGFGAWMFGPQIFRIATDQGEIVIETNDPNVQIEVSQGGELVEVIDLRTKQSLQIRSGTYQIQAVGDENSLAIDKDRLTLTRGETEIVKITKTEQSSTAAKSTASSVEPSEGLNPLRSLRDANQYQNGNREKVSQLAFDPNYKVKPGDVLGVFVENVLGEFRTADKVQIPAGNLEFLQNGFPVPVRQNGTISLPLIDPVPVAGKTAFEIEQALLKTYRAEKVFAPATKQVVTVTIRDIYEPTGNATLTEPVYDGMTFEQCLNAIKFERDGEKLVKPFTGLLELSDAAEQPQIVDSLVEALIRIRLLNRTTNLEARLAQWLTDEQLQNVTLKLGAGEKYDEWSLFQYLLLRAPNAPYIPDARWERLKPVKDQIIALVVSAVKENRIADQLPFVTYHTLVTRQIIDPDKFPDASQAMLAYMDAVQNSNQAAYKYHGVAKAWPSMQGLGAAIAKRLSSNWRAKDLQIWGEAIKSCSVENQKDPAVAFAKIVLDKNNYKAFQGYAKRLIPVFEQLPEEVFALVRPIMDANLSHPMALRLKQAERERQSK